MGSTNIITSPILNGEGYSPVGDISVTALCFTILIFLILNRIQRGNNYKILFTMVLADLLAALTNLCYTINLFAPPLNAGLLYTLRIASHICMSLIQMGYVLYLREPLWMKNEGYNKFIVMICTVATAPIIIDILGIVFRFGFYIENDTPHSEFTVYPFSYVAFSVIIFYLIIKYRSRIIKQIFWCLIGVNILAFLMTSIQGINHETSFTTLNYCIPVLGLLFMFHSNPYDHQTGAASDTYLTQELSRCIEKKKPLVIFWCSITDFYEKMHNDADLKAEFFRFIKQSVKHGVLYRLTSGNLVLTVKKTKNVNFERLMGKMLDDFYTCYQNIGIDYKLIIAEIVPEITDPSDYVRLLQFIEGEMYTNETKRISDADIKRYLSTKYILSELEDIAKHRDVDDERVLVYCQPVFNLITGTYDTAEALMRLKLPETGLVFPDKFIPIAERYGLIHQLSLTILNKTCRMIHDLISEDYLIKRISVNFSTLDLKHEFFCDEVQDIIIRNDIPYDKIAIEITESRSETEFNRLKSKVTELQSLGIKFYLDDFGTGYSNFERIMEIPFDIIKFDRSMLIESNKNDSSKYMVTTFASMFNDLHYAVLFEGVEDENDEEHCKNMFAKYLQGYKYSKPIPMTDLRNFLEKAV